MTFLENRIPPPVIVLITGLGMWIATYYLPALTITLGTRLVIAGVLVLLGLACLVSGLAAFRRSKTTVDPVRIERASSLVKEGIFRYTRNPMYVGFALLLLAWSAFLASPWTVLGPIFFVLYINRFQIIPEERVMQKKFGSAYADYRNSVRRWL